MSLLVIRITTVSTSILFSLTAEAAGMEVKPDTGIFLSKANGNQIKMFDPSLEYAFGTGHFPCGRPNEKQLALSDQDRAQYIKKNCNLNLYSYGKEGFESIRVVKTELKSVQGMCGNQEPQIESVISPLTKPSYFVTSLKPAAVNPVFIPAKNLVASGLSPKDKSSFEKTIALPKDSKISAVYSYDYSPWKYLLQVQETKIASGDLDKSRPNGQISASAFYIVGNKKSQKLTPDDVYLPAFYGEVSELIGLAYLTRKDRPDILIGKDDVVNFIVLSKAFNHIVFPFLPPGGC